jgi:hypothetical protein
MTNLSNLDANTLFSSIPNTLKDELLTAFKAIIKNYREGHWEPSELNGGKLCEVVYSIILGYIENNYPPTSSKPNNMYSACCDLEKRPATFSRSVRIQIPRMLIALYEIRNNRGVGHAGGDINPNRMDATCVVYMSKWIIAELIRVFHNVDTKTAETSIDIIIDRTLPVVWKVGDKSRILDTKATMKEKTLLLLYQNSTSLKVTDLFEFVEHSNASNYRRDVIRPLHKDKLIEYDEVNQFVYISPKGIMLVENVILKKVGSLFQ